MKRITRIFLVAVLCLATSFGLTITSDAAEADKTCTEAIRAMETLPYTGGAIVNDTDECDVNSGDVAENKGNEYDVNSSDLVENEGNEYDVNSDDLVENEGDEYNDGDEAREHGKEGDDNTEKETKNDFQEIYNVAMNHISEILSLAAFVGSLICAIIYKSGLMPLMENGLKSLKNAALKIKEATDKAECESKESISTISRKIDEIEDTMVDMCDAFLEMTNVLEGYEDQRAHQKRLDTVLSGELDMLYDIFMTSALPEYEKARVSERMTKLKEALNSGESE